MEDTSSEERMDRLMEKARADASRILVSTSQLKGLLKDNEIAEASVEKRSRELEVKEKNLQSLSLDLEKRRQIFEKEKANHEIVFEYNVKKRSRELDHKETELQRWSLDLQKRCQIFERERAEAGNLLKLVADCSEELRTKRNELTVKLDSLTRTQRELEFRETRLGQVTAELQRCCNEVRTVGDRKRELEGEIAKRKTELAQILDQIKESGKQFVMVDEQLESQRRQTGIVSSELVSKEKELERVRESIRLSNSDAELGEYKVKLLNSQITNCAQAIDMKTKEMGDIQKLVEEQTKELGVMHKQRDFLKLTIQELSEKLLTEVEKHKEMSQAIDRISSEMEERAKEVKAAETKASELNATSQRFKQDVEDKLKELDRLKNRIESGEKTLFQLKREIEEGAKGIKAAESEARGLSVNSERFRHEVKSKEKELDRLKNQIDSAEKKLIQDSKEMEEVTNRKKKVMEVILSKIQESGKQLVAVNEKLESQQKLLETRSVELVSRDMELECVAESSKQFKFDLEAKEKRLEVLKKLITISSEQLDLKSKELGEVQKLIEEETKKLCDMQKEQPSAAPVNDTSQQNAPEAELVDEDVLTHYESSASLVHDVSSALRASPNPAEIVLDLVQDAISKTSGLEDSAVEILVHLFDEFTKIQQLDQLANIQRPGQYQLQVKATEFATLWKRKITIKAPKSSLEALAFLQFIVAYELKTVINQKETVLLASSIAQYEQASTLFNALGLNAEMIPDIVMELIKKSYYIPAVRFICKFKLNEKFQPSDLLKKEITNLRQSLLKKGPTRCSQAKGKKGRKLRAILEVLADYEELKNDLPGDLIAELMIQSENSISVTHLNLRVPKTELNPS